jgi:hypothetical protein
MRTTKEEETRDKSFSRLIACGLLREHGREQGRSEE